MMSLMSGMMVFHDNGSLIPQPKQIRPNRILEFTINRLFYICHISGVVVYIAPSETFSNFSSLGLGYIILICYVLMTSY